MTQPNPNNRFYLHLVSDSTGTTLHEISRACIAQFENLAPREKHWNFVRTQTQLNQVIEGITETPGIVLFTLVSEDLRARLLLACNNLNIPCIPVLEPTLRGFSTYLGVRVHQKPGTQHVLNDAYFARIDALDFTLHHDDGQNLEGIAEADVILVGVSRTSKTPTAIYLAGRGIKAANIPLVPGVDVPQSAFLHPKPLYVGLIESPQRLLELRKTRLKSGDTLDPRLEASRYLASDAVEDEIKAARKIFSAHKWPVIDVTRRSVEETSAEIMILLNRRTDATL